MRADSLLASSSCCVMVARILFQRAKLRVFRENITRNEKKYLLSFLKAIIPIIHISFKNKETNYPNLF